MKLLTAANSPFGARVEIAARAKGISLETKPLPADGLKSHEFLAVNPLGKIPVLLPENGAPVPESLAILAYFEDRYPKPSLRPQQPEARARINVAVAIMDGYVMPPVIRLFSHLAPAGRDEKVVADEVARWRAGLAALATVMADPLPGAEASVSLADCVLAPSLHLCRRIAAMLGLESDPALPHSVLIGYYDAIRSNRVVGPVLAELTAAQEQSDLKAGRPSLAHLH